jgi:hypothetical protein
VRINLIICFSIFYLSSFAQEQKKEVFQADSIIRKNNIRIKIQLSPKYPSLPKEIYKFNNQGRLIKYLLTAYMNENKITYSMSYFYDKDNKLKKIIDTTFYGKKKKVTNTEYIYDTNGNYKAFQFVKKKKIISEIIYQADSNKETHYYYNDSKIVFRKVIDYYEKPNITYKNIESIEENDSRKMFTVNGIRWYYNRRGTWIETYNNKFDSNGNLIEREVIGNAGLERRHLYKYDTSGLLIEIKTIFYHQKEIIDTELIRYKKWD